MTQSILLVDDSRTMLQVLRVYLMGRAFNFLDAENAERAMRLLRLVPVSLVILDVNMPGMDGITFLQQLRSSELRHLQTVPVVVVTAMKDEAVEARARAVGASAFLHKPLDGELVARVVDGLLAQRST